MGAADQLARQYGILARPGGGKVVCPSCNHTTFSITADDSFGKCWRPSCDFRFGNQNKTGATGNSFTTVQPSLLEAQEAVPAGGCTLQQYSEHKKLPVEFLLSLQLSDRKYQGHSAVAIPYLGADGTEIAKRYRTALHRHCDPDPRFRWKSGSKLQLYGLWRIQEWEDPTDIVLVEGESDCHTLWYHDVPALGIPGAQTFKTEWEKHLEGFEKVYMFAEPDGGGDVFVERMKTAGFASKVYVLTLSDYKDPSELHCSEPESFESTWREVVQSAIPLADCVSRTEKERAQEAWKKCATLAQSHSILARFEAELRAGGYVGDTRAAKLVYLALVSRVLARPVSIVLKAPSSAGKSFTVESTLTYFPQSAFYTLTSMSDKALAYFDEPLSHRTLVLFEAVGAKSETGSYLLRSLLSEGEIRYQTVEKTNNGMRPRHIHIPGPTGLITTTTAVTLHAENETRLLSVSISDTTGQTRAVIHSIFAELPPCKPDDIWLALQSWIAVQPAKVVIPYGEFLAKKLSGAAVRMRRDAKTLKTLIEAHAILHQASRDRREDGTIIASIEDYRVVHALVHDIMSEGIGQVVSPTVRETVLAVQGLVLKHPEGVTAKVVAKELRIDKSSASRRIRQALDEGYLINQEERKRRPMKLVIGEPMPGDMEALPHPDELASCAVAPEQPRIPETIDSTGRECIIDPDGGIGMPHDEPPTEENWSSLLEQTVVADEQLDFSYTDAELSAMEAAVRRSLEQPPS